MHMYIGVELKSTIFGFEKKGAKEKVGKYIKNVIHHKQGNIFN